MKKKTTKKPKRQNICILIKQDDEPILRGNFKKLCNEFMLPYHSLKMKKFPIFHDDIVIYKKRLC